MDTKTLGKWQGWTYIILIFLILSSIVLGPIVIRTKKRKSEPTSYDVEAAEKQNLEQGDEDELGKDDKEVELQKLNPDGTSAEKAVIVKK